MRWTQNFHFRLGFASFRFVIVASCVAIFLDVVGPLCRLDPPPRDAAEHIEHRLELVPLRIRAEKRLRTPDLETWKQVTDGAQYFSVIDFSRAFDSIRLHPDEAKMLSTEVDGKRLQWQTICQGAMNSGTTWQTACDHIFAGVEAAAWSKMKNPPLSTPTTNGIATKKRTYFYVDDGLVATATREENEAIVKEILERADAAGICVSVKKCVFAQRTVSFLGKIVSSKGTFCAASALSKIFNVDHTDLVSVKQVRGFLGALDQCAKWMPGAALNTTELRGMISGNVSSRTKVKWTPAAIAEIERLKNLARSGGIRYTTLQPDDRTVYVEVDASKDGCGAIFYTKRGVLRFVSCRYTKTESSLESRLLQLLGLKKALVAAKDLLLGAHVVVRTDHMPITFYFGKNPTIPTDPRTIRWLQAIEAIGVDEVHYIQGERLIAADYLSRVTSKQLPKPLSDAELLRRHDADHATFLKHVERMEIATVKDDALEEIKAQVASTLQLEGKEKEETRNRARLALAKAKIQNRSGAMKPEQVEILNSLFAETPQELCEMDDDDELALRHEFSEEERQLIEEARHHILLRDEEEAALKRELGLSRARIQSAQAEDSELSRFAVLHSQEELSAEERREYEASPYFQRSPQPACRTQHPRAHTQKIK